VSARPIERHIDGDDGMSNIRPCARHGEVLRWQKKSITPLISAGPEKRFLAERRELVADLTQPYQRGDGEKRERFMVIQSLIEAIDRAVADEERMARAESVL
jgi:hypothetical protein